jgi:outer membrane protein assembly factor BamD
MKIKFKKSIILLTIILSISACANVERNKKLDTNKSAEQIYNEAMDFLSQKRYIKAATTFEQVELEHPYSKWATKSKIMSAFAYYSKNKYNDAIIALERFIKLHPGNEQAPYAYYLLAICNYEQISDIGRDQSITNDAHKALLQLIKRFPDSKYAKDARNKLKLTTDHLAGKEMEIGRYYQKQQKYIAAINRFNVVVNEYETTTHVQEALYRLTETYTIIGMKKEAEANAKVLGHNYPKSKWYKKAYNLIGNTSTFEKNGSIDYKAKKNIETGTIVEKETKNENDIKIINDTNIKIEKISPQEEIKATSHKLENTKNEIHEDTIEKKSIDKSNPEIQYIYK